MFRKQQRFPRISSLLICCWSVLSPLPSTVDTLSRDKVFEISQMNNDFGLVMQSILGRQIGGNVVFSPFSLRTVLAMLKVGAVGRTEAALAHFLKDDDRTDQFYDNYGQILHFIQETCPEVVIANRIFSEAGTRVSMQFFTKVHEYFSSVTKVLASHDPNYACRQINQWALNVTHGLVTNVLSPGTLPDSVLDDVYRASIILVNVMYFKGTWQYQFNPAKPKTFHLDLWRTTTVEMMWTTAKYKVLKNDHVGAWIVAIPYTGNYEGADRLHMILVVPFEINGLEHVESQLSNLSFKDIRAVYDEPRQEIRLELPKFKIGSKIDLKNILTELGYGIIFDPKKANFMKIAAEQKMYVSTLKQQAKITVDERGNDVAVMTSVGRWFSSSSPKNHIIVDRPFLGYIHDEASDTVLFCFRKSTF